MPQAEASGLIVPLGDWVLGRALADLARWLDEGRDLLMSVNVSPSQLREPDFAGSLLARMADFGVPPHALCVEVTERVLIHDGAVVTESLLDLRKAGELGSQPRRTAIVTAVLKVAADLGLSVVAEGVETGDERRWLIELGCPQAQGFLLGRPVPLEQFPCPRASLGVVHTPAK